MTMCDKLGYPTRKAAMDAIAEICKRENQSMKVYQCADCNEFHLATEGKKGIPIIKHNRIQGKYNSENPYGSKRNMQPITPLLATQKLISNDMAKHLKRLIEGRNQIEKTINYATTKNIDQ